MGPELNGQMPLRNMKIESRSPLILVLLIECVEHLLTEKLNCQLNLGEIW